MDTHAITEYTYAKFIYVAYGENDIHASNRQTNRQTDLHHICLNKNKHVKKGKTKTTDKSDLSDIL